MYEWCCLAAAGGSIGAFALPVEGRSLSSQPCGLPDHHTLQLQIEVASGLADIKPLIFTFPYSDDPTSVGDISQQLEVVGRLEPQHFNLTQVCCVSYNQGASVSTAPASFAAIIASCFYTNQQ